jgi:UDP-perosamine 4-acetyltransferase
MNFPIDLPVIVIGAGGHAKVAIEALKLRRRPVLGIVDADPSQTGRTILGVPVIGDDGKVFGRDPAMVLLVNGIGSVGSAERRRAVYRRFRDAGFRFGTVVHPSAVIASDAVLEEGAQVMAGAVIQPGCRIGENAIVNTRASVDHDCDVGDHAHLAPGAVLSGSVQVGEGAHVGTGASVIQGIRIGRNSVVGAGAVVVRDVPDDSVVYGVPAKGKKE